MDNRESIKFESVAVNGDVASVVLVVPSSLLPVFKTVLDSLFSLASSIEAKRRHSVAGTSQSFKDECDKRYKALSSRVISEFHKHYTGTNYRQAVSATNKVLSSSGWPVTCGVIENVLRQERRENAV